MEIIQVPEAAKQQPQIAVGDIAFVDYSDHPDPSRNRVWFNCYAFSFVQNGQKTIYRAGGSTVLKPGQGMLISEGNSIIAEHSDNQSKYRSIIVFFPRRLGRAFIDSLGPQAFEPKQDVPYVHFGTDHYIQKYISNISSLISGRQALSPALAAVKVQELLTAVFDLAPELLLSIFGGHKNTSLKNLVENNLLNPLTLDELAFLANRSLSSFKRDFQKAYGLSPQKYIRDRRLELASSEIANGKLASEIYLDYGYQHLSNFNTAFKRKYGLTPADFR